MITTILFTGAAIGVVFCAVVVVMLSIGSAKQSKHEEEDAQVDDVLARIRLTH